MSDNDDRWFTDDVFVPEPVNPGGAAAGPGAIGPVPASLVSNTTSSDDDWFTAPGWHDNNTAVDPGGAAAGPGAIGPVPASLISNTTTAPGGPGGAGTNAPFQVDYAELEKFAKDHDLNAEEIAQWATGDPDFPERYLATHGKVNYGTYLKIREFMASKQIAGTTFAEHNVQTSTALRASIASTKATEETNAAAFDATRMV
jgi:Excreted virulence factor EspC, type VII ESX diderm